MIPTTGVEDQELSIAPERTGVNNPTVTRGCDLCTGFCCQRNASFYAAGAVGTTKIANLGAINRQCDRWALAGRVLEGCDGGLTVNGSGCPLEGRGRGRLCGALQIPLHFGDQALQAVDLPGQPDGPGALGFHVFLDCGFFGLSAP